MVTDLVDDSENPNLATGAWLRTLDDIEGVDLPLVGGKAFRLAKLKQEGLNVPPGLILTTEFFKAHIKHTKLIPLWMGSPDIAVTTDSLSWLADALKTTPINQTLMSHLNQRFTELFGQKINSFAVRSSAIDEDQRDHTFAGIHLTELGVPREALPIAITRCWASALSEPALEYRQVHGMSIQGIQIALLIQPMLTPAISGVGFTVNPLTGSREEMVIEATWGLGESLVSGKTQPYFYKLAHQPPAYPLIEQHAGQPADTDTAPLSPETLTELALHFERIQALMGEPQDIEWARQDEMFFILQTRPVALPPPTPQVPDPEWTRGSHPEYLPDLPSPLFSSLLERTQPQAVTFFEGLGLTIENLGPYLKLILGRPYLNLTFLKRMISQVGIRPGNLLYTIGHTDIGEIGRRLSIDWSVAWQGRQAYWRVFTYLFTMPRLLRQYQRFVADVAATLAEADMEAAPTTLLSQLRLHEQLYGEFYKTRLPMASILSSVTAVGSSLIAPMPQNPATIITALAQHDVATFDRELNQSLSRLGRLAHTDAATANYLTNAAPDFHDFAENPAISGEFRRAFDETLAKFGHRGAYEADLGQPRYNESPAALLRVIKQYAENDQQANKPGQPVTWQSLAGSPSGLSRWVPWRRWVAAPVIAMVRRLLVLREGLNSARAQAMTATRRWDLALGQQWVVQGWLEQPTDIFWLTLNEVEQVLIADSAVGVTLSSTVRARKETYQTYAETPMPFTLHESQIFAIQPGQGFLPEDVMNVLVGLPISPGQVRGSIIVLHSPNDFKTKIDNAILVMPSTDPTWLPLLHRAAGLIVEMGGLLSHGSVIAREYGVPGVANIPDATKRFQNGEVVLLDGSTGVVQRLEGA